jgi:distribution and morphology protein 12
MSFDIDWSKLDGVLAGHVKEFLNKHFQTITKPSFIGDLKVTDFGWGTETPSVEIIDITEPFPEFYELDDEQQEQQQKEEQKEQEIPRSPPAPASDLFSEENVNTARLSLNNPLSQQQRFNLVHSFHRSPFVAPQHPFSSAMSSNTQYHPATPTNYNPTSGLYFPTTSTPSDPWHSQPTASVIEEDWIDDEEINRVPNGPSIVSSGGSSTRDKKSTEMDFQVHMLISYKGDMSMTVLTELRMNYPSMMFMSLPIQLHVKSIEFEATAVVAYIQSMSRVCVSMLEPEQPVRGKDIGLER